MGHGKARRTFPTVVVSFSADKVGASRSGLRAVVARWDDVQTPTTRSPVEASRGRGRAVAAIKASLAAADGALEEA
jgi:hypothetical protein